MNEKAIPGSELLRSIVMEVEADNGNTFYYYYGMINQIIEFTFVEIENGWSWYNDSLSVQNFSFKISSVEPIGMKNGKYRYAFTLVNIGDSDTIDYFYSYIRNDHNGTGAVNLSSIIVFPYWTNLRVFWLQNATPYHLKPDILRFTSIGKTPITDEIDEINILDSAYRIISSIVNDLIEFYLDALSYYLAHVKRYDYTFKVIKDPDRPGEDEDTYYILFEWSSSKGVMVRGITVFDEDNSVKKDWAHYIKFPLIDTIDDFEFKDLTGLIFDICGIAFRIYFGYRASSIHCIQGYEAEKIRSFISDNANESKYYDSQYRYHSYVVDPLLVRSM